MELENLLKSEDKKQPFKERCRDYYKRLHHYRESVNEFHNNCMGEVRYGKIAAAASTLIGYGLFIGLIYHYGWNASDSDPNVCMGGMLAGILIVLGTVSFIVERDGSN